jgi:FtsH-binding integral membrane protein
MGSNSIANKQVEHYTLGNKQTTTLTRSLMVCGVAFISICAFSYGLYMILNNYITEENVQIIPILYGVSFVLLIVSMFMSMFTFSRIEKTSIVTILIAIILYSIAEGIAFGILFFAISRSFEETVNLSDLCFIFGIGGGIFLISGFIGTLMSNKTTVTLGKILSIMTIILLLVFLPLMLILAFIPGVQVFSDKLFALYNIIAGVLFILYAAYDFSVIKKMEQYIKLQSDKIQLKYVLMFGFKLLIDLIGII